MMRFLIGLLVAMLAATAFAGPPPETCIVPRGEKAIASTEFNGRTYRFTNTECRDEFLSDPERYSQLYDALAELGEAGTPLQPESASLVPS